MRNESKGRLLAIFFRIMAGEDIYTSELANHYGVSQKSIQRDLNEIKEFFSDNQGDLVGSSNLYRDPKKKCYRYHNENYLTAKEMFSVMKILIGTRAYYQTDLNEILGKLEKFTSRDNIDFLKGLTKKECREYQGVLAQDNLLLNTLWDLAHYISEKNEITIDYVKMNRSQVERKLKPIAIMFSEYYFYLIAYQDGDEKYTPKYFRVDRIKKICCHRTKFELPRNVTFDEGKLRKKIHFMFPGEERNIRFEFTGPSVQAILDRIPTARVVAKKNGVSTIEAMTYGTGIKMFLLSQGSWVKVLSPPSFVREMKEEIQKMASFYEVEKKD